MATTRRVLLLGLLGGAALSGSIRTAGAGSAIDAQATPPPSPIEFSEGVRWLTWNAAAAAVTTGPTPRMRMLFVYADWCGVCRRLAPLFDRPDVQQAASALAMVRQNQDEMPSWLRPYLATGKYVPRVLFLDAEGQVRKDITSGRDDYPFFYEDARTLLVSMRAAART